MSGIIIGIGIGIPFSIVYGITPPPSGSSLSAENGNLLLAENGSFLITE